MPCYRAHLHRLFSNREKIRRDKRKALANCQASLASVRSCLGHQSHHRDCNDSVSRLEMVPRISQRRKERKTERKKGPAAKQMTVSQWSFQRGCINYVQIPKGRARLDPRFWLLHFAGYPIESGLVTNFVQPNNSCGFQGKRHQAFIQTSWTDKTENFIAIRNLEPYSDLDIWCSLSTLNYLKGILISWISSYYVF